MGRQSLSALTRRRDFDSVFKTGKSLSSKYLVVYAKPNALDSSRLGLAVSRKIGKAVARNRIKRLLREALRTLSEEIPLPCDFVIVARRLAPEAGLEDFIQDINKVLLRLKNEKNSDPAD